jgi:methylamine utilization protein MauE
MDESGDKNAAFAGGGYVVVRMILGGVLLVAAALKGYQLATEPTAEISLMTSRWFLIGSVEFEVLLGLCLISGLFVRASWLISLGCFALFSCVSLYKALSGEASCGCFGSVQVNPWYTLSLDVAAVVALLRWRPALFASAEPTGESRPASRYAIVLGVWLVVGLSAGWQMARFEAVTVSDEGDFLGDGEIVVLEPEKWVGKRFPLLQHIDIGDQLAEGGWVVLLYHHDCPQCREVLPGYEHMAEDHSSEGVALIEVPPFGGHGGFAPRGLAQRGRLQETKDWFVQTPTELRLDGGVVTAVQGADSLGHGEDAIGRDVAQPHGSESRQVAAGEVQHGPGDVQ